MEKLTLRSNVVQFHRNRKPSGVPFSCLHHICFQDSGAWAKRAVWNKKGNLSPPFHKSWFYSSGDVLNKQSRKEMVANSSADGILQGNKWEVNAETEILKDICILFFFPFTSVRLLSTSSLFSCVLEKRQSPFRSTVLHTSWMSRRTVAQWSFSSYFLVLIWQKHLVGSPNTSLSTEAPGLHKMGARPVLISEKDACKCLQGSTGNGPLGVCSGILLLSTTEKWVRWYKVQLLFCALHSECVVSFFFLPRFSLAFFV